MDEINFYAQFFEHPPYYCTLYTQSYYSTITVYGSTLLHVYMQARISTVADVANAMRPGLDLGSPALVTDRVSAWVPGNQSNEE